MSEINEDSTSSEKQFENVFKLIPNPIYLFERVENDLILVDYNEAAKVFSKGKIDEYLGLKMSDLYPEHLDLIEELKNDVDIKGHLSRESKFKSKSTGIEKTVNTTWCKISPDLILVILYDITTQRQVEDALRKSEREKSLIFENIPELIVFQDTNHSIIWCNKAACESVDLSLEQIIGRKCFEIWQNRNLVCENCSLDIALKTGRQEKAEAITPDGRIWDIRGYPVRDDKGNIVGAVELTTDITEPKKVAQKLKESEEKFRNIFESIPLGMHLYELDSDRNLVFKGANPFADKILGLDNSQFISKTIEEAFPPLAQTDIPDRYRKAASDDISSQWDQVAYEDEKIKGAYEVLAFQTSQNNMVATFTDITNRLETERKLKESEKKYREAFNRSELYKDIFTHDINNILQNILSSVELSNLYSNDPEEREKFKDVSNLIDEQILRGKKLVSNVQKLSEVEEIETPITSVEAAKILGSAIKFVKESYSHKVININVDSYQNQYYVYANELLINIFENILFNAVKHNVHENVEILVRISKDNKNGMKFIKFEFIDNGVGIPDLMKTEIFSRKHKEFKKEQIPSGIGLGLLLVNRILESYNGEIRVEDRIEGDYSKGSNFIILIPEAG